jgi:glucose/arabinose dehydrogenase
MFAQAANILFRQHAALSRQDARPSPCACAEAHTSEYAMNEPSRLLRRAAWLGLIALAGCGGGGGTVTPPPSGLSATLTAPANFATALTGTVTLSASASDASVAGVEFQIDGVRIGSIDSAAPYSVTLDTTTYPSGQHVLRARANDAAGDVSSWSTALVQFGGGVAQPSGFTRNESWVTGLSSATAFAQAPDGRLFVAEQGGTLRVIKNGVLLATPFATFPVDSAGERGLIGVALHPAFATNGFVYVYSTRKAGTISHNRISRLTANGDVAAVGTEFALVDLPNLSSATNHNGGGMHFGPDGKLYVGVGENANPPAAQDLSQPFGKLLRFNDDGTIPTDNPFFATQAGLGQAVWAYGLRNPFTFSFQPGTGVLHIDDVGQDTWEEIDVGAAGANYGWPNSEGPDNVTAGITGPLFSYKHSDASPLGSGPGGFFKGFAIAGGSFYPTAGPFPAGYRSQYYFADYVSQFVGRLDLANGNAAYAFASLSNAPVDLLVGLDGAVYVLTRGGVTRISSP